MGVDLSPYAQSLFVPSKHMIRIRKIALRGENVAVAKNSSGVGVHVAVALALKTVTFARLTPSARTRPVRERSVVSKFELEDLPEQFLRQVEQAPKVVVRGRAPAHRGD